MKRKIFALLFVAAMVVSLFGCTSDSSNADYAGKTLVVKVTLIENGKYTGNIGELSNDSTMPGANAPASMPSGDVTGQNNTPPELPSGEAGGENAPSKPSGESDQNAMPPSMPSGGTSGQGGTPPSMPSGGIGSSSFTETEGSVTFTIPEGASITKKNGSSGESASASDIAVDTVLEITFDSSGNISAVVIVPSSSGGSGGFGGSGTVTNGTAANTISSDTSVNGKTYSSSGDDENALRVDGASVTLTDITVDKSAGDSSNTENGDFYGQNAGLLALNGSAVTIRNAAVNTSAVNGNGVFSYGEGTTVNIYNSVIRTTERNSGGIQTTGGGTTNAYNLDVETKGASAAAIRSDRGGGTVNVDGGKYVTDGTGSPAIYSTANITVKNSTLTANNSEAVVVEGKNSVALENCTVTGNMSGTYANDNSENIHNIMIYQSMSGDADVGHSTFTMSGGSLVSKNGDMFYVTNTTCTISLKNVAMTLANDVLLRVEGNSSSRGWGTSGANGGACTLTCEDQTMNGKIIVDKISSLDMTLSGSSVFTGTINSDANAGEVKVTLNDGAKWVLNGNSYITSFSGDKSAITTNGYTVYVNGEALS